MAIVLCPGRTPCRAGLDGWLAGWWDGWIMYRMDPSLSSLGMFAWLLGCLARLPPCGLRRSCQRPASCWMGSVLWLAPRLNRKLSNGWQHAGPNRVTVVQMEDMCTCFLVLACFLEPFTKKS
jgi:hypothetical protein